MLGLLKRIFGTAQDRLLRRYRKMVAEVNVWDEQYSSLSDEELRAKTDEFRRRIHEGAHVDAILPEAYAVVKNVCRRLSGSEVHVSGYDQRWDMIPFDVQVLGAIAMHYGAIAEMMTGEGKTLTAVMPLYLNALTGKPVHLVTVNDYLATRDCQWVGAILRWLGMTTGALTNDVPYHERKKIYASDIVYGTASEFGFDYLRDNSMVSSQDQQVQRGHYFAIVDEIDSILIDEARTPLIISGPAPESRQLYAELKKGAEELVREQREFCSRLAAEAKKGLDKAATMPLGKERSAIQEEACKKLWLVSKGTPHNRTLKRIKEDPDMRAALDGWDLYYYNDQNKQEKHDSIAQLYMTVDEKGNEFELTDKGIAAWAGSPHGGSADDFLMLDMGHEYQKIDSDDGLSPEGKTQKKAAIQEEDAQRKERSHNLRQLLRAHLLMERDVEYIVQEGKIVIIDEHTGRPQPGRRFSDGLHQAIEAKEGVEIQKETQTYATITLQNYFRLYEKLAGMTGTAMTEAGEFKEIYNLDVLEIPTHKKCIRTDANDEIYMTEREKYQAILKEVQEIHRQGRPILIGTESVEISEKLSRIFKQNQLPHTVLNAKYHDKEAEIIAHAGHEAAITIATNMAGRGTDIKLDPGIATKGGLYVMGTTRHQSRRIDRQLRGRCARQGDPGSSKFYVSFEDPLLRLFASPRVTAILQKFRPPEGEPISARMLNRSIETAQKRVEQRNFMIRKHTLEYDDVMNKQRQEIYAFRNDLLHAEEIRPLIHDTLFAVCQMGAEQFFRYRGEEGGWDPEGYRHWLMEHFPVSFDEGYFDNDYWEVSDMEEAAFAKVKAALDEKMDADNEKIPVMDQENAIIPPKPADVLARNIMIQRLDQLWQEHLLHMDHLRADVNLRTVGQRDPLMEFKEEAFRLFDGMSRNLRTEIARALFRFRLLTFEEVRAQQQTMRTTQVKLETHRSLAGEVESDGEPHNGESHDDSFEKKQPFVAGPRVGRNDPCPCGSGKKYKKCCGVEHEEHISS